MEDNTTTSNPDTFVKALGELAGLEQKIAESATKLENQTVALAFRLILEGLRLIRLEAGK